MHPIRQYWRRQRALRAAQIQRQTARDCRTGCAVDVLLRPDDIQHDDASPHQTNVAAKTFRCADILYTLALPSGQKILSLVPSHHDHVLGEKIGIRLEVDHLVAFWRG